MHAVNERAVERELSDINCITATYNLNLEITASYKRKRN